MQSLALMLHICINDLILQVLHVLPAKTDFIKFSFKIEE